LGGAAFGGAAVGVLPVRVGDVAGVIEAVVDGVATAVGDRAQAVRSVVGGVGVATVAKGNRGTSPLLILLAQDHHPLHRIVDQYGNHFIPGHSSTLSDRGSIAPQNPHLPCRSFPGDGNNMISSAPSV
jgi:hypothetical protein